MVSFGDMIFMQFPEAPSKLVKQTPCLDGPLAKHYVAMI